MRSSATLGTARARASGLTTRPLDDTLRDALAWEETGRTTARFAGLTGEDERRLRAQLDEDERRLRAQLDDDER